MVLDLITGVEGGNVMYHHITDAHHLSLNAPKAVATSAMLLMLTACTPAQNATWEDEGNYTLKGLGYDQAGHAGTLGPSVVGPSGPISMAKTKQQPLV